MHEIRTASIVVPMRNGLPHVTLTLAAIAALVSDISYEVVLVDDGSHDGSPAVVRQCASTYGMNLEIVAGPQRGPGPARNCGAAVAEGDLVLFTDHDDEVDVNWLTEHLRAAQEWPALGGHLDEVSLNPESHQGRRPATPGRLPGNPPYPIGCNMAVTKALFDDIGGFPDPWTPTGGEDSVIGVLLARAGYPALYVPGAIVRYRYRNSLAAAWRQHYDYGVSAPYVARESRRIGIQPKHSARNIVYNYGGAVALAPLAMLSRRWRGRWLNCAAISAGRIRGSLSSRTFWLG